MLKKLDGLKGRYNELTKLISDPELVKDQKKYKTVMQDYTHLSEIMEAANSYQELISSLADAREMLSAEKDPEMKEMAKEEIDSLEKDVEEMEQKIRFLMVPKDPLDGKNIIMEIRAGTGGDEAALFAADLYRAYSRYAETKNWKVEIMSSNEIELGGFKEIVCSISGKSVYADLRYESGVHRVQRVPATESGGRIHTSAITVAVLPEAEETDLKIRTEDLKVDVFRSSGPGGQSVNTTDSAIRITHLPTGVVVICQDEKSQIKNKAKALRVLRSRLLEAEEAKKNSERAEARRSQVGSGDRSERIRTYNFPQNRVTDHRINLTLYKLDAVMQGDLSDFFNALKMSAQEEALKTERI
ncbi:peptide chain release factor 1 [Oceanispirochaeta sp.]|jgi:peptide chain release factor 1|uniref:peptide chain release factor 1 n=1 Tax=Oceanispirochaeta sp. TaxID=2035350 RepID=UPI002605C91F|nr:peptide chain release factor 1 [Oceanispirochaeta sp.]MDA3958514.1 peptide chain release factor 1 [Oceanispirochaeta sp.]